MKIAIPLTKVQFKNQNNATKQTMRVSGNVKIVGTQEESMFIFYASTWTKVTISPWLNNLLVAEEMTSYFL